MKKIFTAVLFFSFAFSISAQTYLRVLDPQTFWSGDDGTIEEVQITMTPEGVYCKNEVFIIFSARDTYFSENDMLEVEMYFDLLPGSFITDLWLWVGEEISHAYVLDTWTANEVYEGIVNRRRDPAILFKRGENNYELRVYPLMGNETRKVKLEFYSPLNFQYELALAPVPVEFVMVDKNKITSVDLRINANSHYDNPHLVNHPSFTFEENYEPGGKKYFSAQLNSEILREGVTISYPSPMQNGIYYSYSDNGSEGEYILQINPKSLFEFQVRKNVVFILDHEIGKTLVTREQIKNELKLFVESNFSPADSFNIILSNLEVSQLSESWIASTDENIETVFNSFSTGDISTYSNINASLKKAIEFVTEKGGFGEIVLFSSADALGSIEAMYDLALDLKELNSGEIKISVADYASENLQVYRYNGIDYRGNEYFYKLITQTTGGTYLTYRDSYRNIHNFINSLKLTIDGSIELFDIYTSLESGYCHSRITNPGMQQSIGLNETITQFGKYIGEFPFKMVFSGVFQDEIISQEFDINPGQPDSSVGFQYTANYLSFLDNGGQANISNIIKLSIENRILTSYTSFLALEPGDTLNVCLDCIGVDDPPITTKEDELIITDFSLSAYPNPFNSQVKIEVKIPENYEISEASFKIINVLGEEVKTFNPAEISAPGTYTFFWNGLDENGNTLASGVYIFVASTPSKVSTLKLLYLK